MQIWLLLTFLTAVQGQKKVCFAPVACSAGDVTSSEWMEIKSKSQCNSKHSEETLPTQATITESRVKSLIDESVAKFRSKLANLLSTKSDSDEFKRLRNDVKEMNWTLNQNNARLERELTKINKSLHFLNALQEPKLAFPQPGDITYNDKYYWLILHNSADVNFTQAQNLCSQRGGSPGDILSQAHYDLVSAKFRNMTSLTKYFWLGMKINPTPVAPTSVVLGSCVR